MRKSILITGSSGGIGKSLVEVFVTAGWHVIGIDRNVPEEQIITEDIKIFRADSDRFIQSPQLLQDFAATIRSYSTDFPLGAIINNAAIQHIAPLKNLSVQSIVSSMNVNVIAPMILVKEFLPELEKQRGVVINIGSVHAESTKPEFVAYATSKTALHGLTRSLAVELGPTIRVNTLAPAATQTPLLLSGFEKNESALQELEKYHPLKRIATPDEISKIALFLTTDDASFLSGSTIYADGGILSRLHDPV